MPGVQPFFKCLGDPNTVAQNWTKWKKSFEYFLGASGIRNDARQKAMLLHMVGPETQEVFETLVPEDNTYEKALKALDEHFSVKKNVPFERSVLQQARQKSGESIEQFVTTLRKLAATCEYGDTTNEQIRDQVIATFTSSKLRKRLLSETDLTLDKVLQIGNIMESAHHHNKEIETKRYIWGSYYHCTHFVIFLEHSCEFSFKLIEIHYPNKSSWANFYRHLYAIQNFVYL